ncbi:helix-turn-helix domain-containing protein [Sporomusa sphaeroides]
MVNLINLPKEICTWQPANPASPNPDNGNGFYPARHVVEVCRGREGRRFLLEENERQEILSLLSAHRGNVSLTARTMGVSRNTLYRKMKQYAIYN